MALSTTEMVCMGVFAFAALALLTGQPHFDASENPDWQGYLVCLTMLAAVMLMINNFHAAFCMIALNLIFVLFKIITPRDFFNGFSSDAVIATATLSVFADAVYQSSILDVVMGPFLPTKASLMEARLRIMLLGFFISSFLNNTPVMAILLPVTEAYAARAGLPLRSLLMPLSFAIFLGSNNTLIGSSSNLTTMAVTAKIVPGYGTAAWPAPNFFSPGLTAFPIGVAGLVFMTLFTTTFLASNQPGKKASFVDRSADNEDTIPDADECLGFPGQPLLSDSYAYLVAFNPIPPFIGQTVGATGLDKSDNLVAMRRIITSSPKGSASLARDTWASHVLKENDLIIFSCTAVGVAQIRKRRGLRLCNEGVDALGEERRMRVLVEAVVGRASGWVGQTVTTCAMQAAFQGRAAVVAVRQAATSSQRVDGKEEEKKYWLKTDESASDDESGRGTAQRAFKVEAGALLLLEAYNDFAKTCPKDHIAMVSAVPGSKPPRWYSPKDKFRMVVVALVLILVIFTAAANILPLSVSGFCAIFAMVFLKIMTPQEAIKAVEGPTLLIIASSGGVGKAIQQTGLGEWLGERFVELSFNSFIGLLIWFYVLMSVLGCFLNNNAQIVLVMPIAYSASLKAGVGFRPFMYLCMFLAHISSFNIPIARAPNLMIVNRGPYTFSDFAVFGNVLQLFLMPVTLWLLWTFEVGDLWKYFNSVCEPYGSLC
jgi:di/tricarboxylate transporter|eukprot:CAMPEP_0174284242 /NCGR_PEP_ID=MMETSP0809-20121228/4989_1 /TAXON_ID=73025 ORGANISM="Eutreptiella gymnastica-like, Strain CCMP1594" /NCGR_SAMPLE_ID=MMETSP0809 /ASSEMBLY_ACC=CAM_ASM_000658 /LENGTH=710 /DNA_ID=CAMNT_0015379639 /DNA_START=43 /DNA_END=2175 /DNA_ORIENTATION=-